MVRQKFDENDARIAADESRKLTLPPTPEAYQAVLPETFQPPPGVKFELNANDPALAQLKSWAHVNGIPQAQFSEILAIEGARELAKETHLEALRQQNFQALGAAKEARIETVSRWLIAQYGEKAKPMIASMATAAQVEIWESQMQKINSPSGTFRQTGREVDTGKLSEDAYNKLSYGEKKAYAAKHSGQAA